MCNRPERITLGAPVPKDPGSATYAIIQQYIVELDNLILVFSEITRLIEDNLIIIDNILEGTRLYSALIPIR